MDKEEIIRKALEKNTDRERFLFFQKEMVKNPETRSLVISKNPLENIKGSMLKGELLENWIKSFSN